MKFAVSISTHPDSQKPEQGFDFVRHAYVPYLQSLDILPILIPNNLADLCAYVAALGVEGVVLTGGGDIAPEHYGQPNTGSGEITPTRDQMEYHLLEWAVEHQRSVLGICRGVQVINVFFGGGLVQDIPSQLHSPINHNGGDPHLIRFTDPRVTGVIGEDEIHVNSHHHQGITLDLLAAPLEAVAVCSGDGLVEAVIHRSKPILGVQWHPERPTPSSDTDRRLFRRFLQGAFWLEDSP
jgi:putative glutamine amidotransferase